MFVERRRDKNNVRNRKLGIYNVCTSGSDKQKNVSEKCKYFLTREF